MNDHQETTRIIGLPLSTVAGTLICLLFLLVADYPPLALGAIVALFFAAYVWMRVMIFLENDRFTPKRLRVGLTWALVGVDDDSQEYDARPVRVYFILLTILLVGLIVRPMLSWIWL